MDNNDKLISEFFNANKHEIEDNGFSERVMRKIHNKENILSNMLYVICIILSSILFFVFNGDILIMNFINQLCNIKFDSLALNINLQTVLIVILVFAIIGFNKVRSLLK